MKGFTKDGKFHPITDYKKGTRKSRDQSAKSTGVKVERKARCIKCKEYKSVLEMGSPSNVCLGCMKRSGSTGFCPVCNYKITRDTEHEVNQHIKDHIEMQEHAGHQGVCDCGVRKERDEALFAKMKKLENYLEHARTQPIPISKKEDQLLLMKAKLGMEDDFTNDDYHRVQFLKGKREIA